MIGKDLVCFMRPTVKKYCILAVILGVLSTTVVSCYEFESSKSGECTENAECLNRTDGRIVCDMVLGVCVEPLPNGSAICGNGIIEKNESCDKADLAGKTCQDFSDFVSGTLACNNSCEFDKSGCIQCTTKNLTKCEQGQICVSGHCFDSNYKVTCGDGILDVNGGEECEGSNLNYKSCADFSGFAAGTLKCNACHFDKTNCLECTDNSHCANRNDGKTVCESNACVAPAPSGTPNVVISQIYPGGGNNNAVYKTKFVELFNSGGAEADISGWTIQYGSAQSESIHQGDYSNDGLCHIPANTKIPVGGYFLIGLKTGKHGNELPKTVDLSCPHMDPGGREGKLFLVDNDEYLTSSIPDSGYVDGIGYGFSINWGEGDNPLDLLDSTTASLRKNSGCTDTHNNGNDFDLVAPNPRNSSSSLNVCTNSPIPKT